VHVDVAAIKGANGWLDAWQTELNEVMNCVHCGFNDRWWYMVQGRSRQVLGVKVLFWEADQFLIRTILAMENKDQHGIFRGSEEHKTRTGPSFPPKVVSAGKNNVAQIFHTCHCCAW